MEFWFSILDCMWVDRSQLRNYQQRYIRKKDDKNERQTTYDWNHVFSVRPIKDYVIIDSFLTGTQFSIKYPRLASLLKEKQIQCLRVSCAKSPHVAVKLDYGEPIENDYAIFETEQEVYSKIQHDFINWAKNIWNTTVNYRLNDVRAPIETFYEKEYKMKAIAMRSFPKSYSLFMKIFLENQINRFNMVEIGPLLKVDISELPALQKQMDITSRLYLMEKPRPRPNSVCLKHPCKVVLPGEVSKTTLSLTEIHEKLAQYAFNNGAKFIASEEALKCLVKTDQKWTINLSVLELLSPERKKDIVYVLGEEILTNKEFLQMRTYRVFKQVLNQALLRVYETEFGYKRMLEAWAHRLNAMEEEEAKIPKTKADLNLNIIGIQHLRQRCQW